MAASKKRIPLQKARAAFNDGEGISQAALARRTKGKVTQATISRIEAGIQTNLLHSTIVALATALELQPDDLAI
jgi:transcriptional regulator with XRE-family HTH domain